MLTQRVELFDSTYGHFTQDVLATIRPPRPSARIAYLVEKAQE
jgi:hypothetical protein